MNGLTRQNRWAPYVFVAPFLGIFAVFTMVPLLQSMFLASRQTFGPNTSQFVGLDNFVDLAGDKYFWKALTNTAVFAAGSLFFQLPCALGLAMLLNRKDIRARALFRLVFFAPSLVGLAFVAVLFALIFEKNTGLLNVVLHSTVGFDREFPWLQDYVMSSLILAAFWMFTGFNMVYFLAALQSVSKDLVEAAMVDGAGAWHRFIHITLPAIRPVASFVVLLSMIGSFQLFELPYLLLGSAGGPDNQGLTIVMYLYQKGFETGDLGYASAIGWVLALLLGVFAVINLLVSRRGEAG